MSAPQLQAMIDSAPEAEIEPPRPLQRPLEPADPFPMEALGNVLGEAALAIVDQVQCPEAIAGQSVLAVATLAVQGHADIELPQGSTAPLSSFFLTVASSGERKSTADRKALGPIRQREKRLRAQYDGALPAYTIRQASWEASRKQILSNSKLSRETKHAELEGLGPPPRAPLTPLLTCTEPTFEGLCLLLQGGHPSVGVFSAEGGQFLGGYGMSKDHRLKTAAALSGLWDGDPIKDVLARLPEERVRGLYDLWPRMIGARCAGAQAAAPMPEAIDRMDEALVWLAWLQRDERYIVWLRAEGVPWKRITHRLGMGRTTAWERFSRALLKISVRLNAIDEQKRPNNKILNKGAGYVLERI